MRSPWIHTRCRTGFTLVELLVVIGIIAVLISLLMPSLSRAKKQAESVACSANLRSIGQMMFMYANDNKGALFPWYAGGGKPVRERWPMIVFGVKPSQINPMPKVMVCPGDVELSPGELNDATAHNVDPMWVKHSYVTNMHIWYDEIRVGRTHKVFSSDIIVVGEKRNTYTDFRMNSNGPGTSQYKDAVETNRHGRMKKSNLLFLDGHVSNEEPAEWRGPNGEVPDDPWDIYPGGNYAKYP